MVIAGMIRRLILAVRGPFSLPGWALTAVLCLAIGGGITPAVSAAEVWLAGVDPFVRQVMRPGEQSDYLDLFEDNAPWPRAATHVQVFKTSTQYLLNAPDEALRRMFAGLRRRGIALGFEALMIPRHEPCGQGIEGYSAPGAIRAAAERTRRLGGVIQAAAMDEPLWYGHHTHQPNACASAIEAVARAVAENVAALRTVFPAARVGDIEPLDLTAPAAWADEIGQFADAYAAATGTRLDFVDADVDWTGPWRPAMTDLAQRLRAKQIALGIIYDGDPLDDMDGAWTRHATERFERVEADPGLAPDQAILQTWMVHPTHMLPEARPDTMTGLVLSYVRPASRLTLWATDGGVAGRLTGADGHAIVGARVELIASDAASIPRLTSRHLTGVVPARAAKALAQLTIECGCSGPAMVNVGPIAYREGNQNIVVTLPRRTPEPQLRDEVTFKVAPGDKVMANSSAFNVTPGDAFNLDIPLGTSRDLSPAGYVALIFLDAAGIEFQRRKLTLTPSELAVTSPPTDATGVFSVAIQTDVSWVGWRGEYSGDQKWRESTAAIPPKEAR